MRGLFDSWMAAQSAQTAAAESVPKRRAPRSRPAQMDKVLQDAVDVARESLADVAPAHHIGEYLGATAEGQRLVTHSFACTDPAYRGWYWISVLARAPRSKKVTVCETALLPGADALHAPSWVPWRERVQPSDLGPRDVLPKLDRDPNLQPGYQQVEVDPGDNVDQIANFEFGLGRERVLSNEGLTNAAARWADSESGKDGDFARKAQAHCGSCGYLMAIAGSMRTQFGVCANAWSPFDGRVVSLDAGCGAHSETAPKDSGNESVPPVVDDKSEQFEMFEPATAQ